MKGLRRRHGITTITLECIIVDVPGINGEGLFDNSSAYCVCIIEYMNENSVQPKVQGHSFPRPPRPRCIPPYK